MTEVLFILVAIIVAYVIYVIVSEQKTTSTSAVSQLKPEKPVEAVKQSTPQSAPKIEKVAAVKSVASATKHAGKRGLKNPNTDEVATTYSNYRFTKRWIKEALVAEGLLDKVYKNDELNAEIEATIKGAVVKLEALDKYRA
jgi:hypothetical protein